MSYTYNTFFFILKILDFRALFPEKNCFFKFWSQNPKKLKIRDSHLVENSISFLLTPFVCDLLQHTLIYDRYSWRPFLAQNRTWRHWNVIFSKIFWPNLTKFLVKVLNWCPIRYWKFGGDILRSSQVIANIREGAESAPPAGRGLRSVKMKHPIARLQKKLRLPAGPSLPVTAYQLAPPSGRCSDVWRSPAAALNRPGPHRTRQRCSGPVCDRPSALGRSQTGPEQRWRVWWGPGTKPAWRRTDRYWNRPEWGINGP